MAEELKKQKRLDSVKELLWQTVESAEPVVCPCDKAALFAQVSNELYDLASVCACFGFFISEMGMRWASRSGKTPVRWRSRGMKFFLCLD